MRYDWILFDLDNTIIDFTESSRESFSEMMEHFQIEEQTHYYSSYKKINAAIWEAFENNEIDVLTLRKRRFELFLKEMNLRGSPDKFSETYLNFLSKKVKYMEGAETLLENLKPKTNLAIITNGLREVQVPRIQNSRLKEYFSVHIISDLIGHSKPDQAYFDHTFQEIGQPAKEKVLVVGDSLNSDIRGGNQYGLETCWYNPNSHINNSVIQPTYEIEHLEQILELVRM